MILSNREKNKKMTLGDKELASMLGVCSPTSQLLFALTDSMTLPPSIPRHTILPLILPQRWKSMFNCL
jgi:hypothetical protein